ncbi:disco-interacting protein 2 homolog C isoform X8 [Hyalella azteca]|uniref:Disco-interacting protein 2 homolog C isoform X8 n=1 Tax=Hyalella azteca TaxID=294128 RepID=A0A979FQ41_HYAAZ|nr:disco-interacting protein 2 homolog C isoform X8 [Hyalella azteca]
MEVNELQTRYKKLDTSYNEPQYRNGSGVISKREEHRYNSYLQRNKHTPIHGSGGRNSETCSSDHKNDSGRDEFFRKSEVSNRVSHENLSNFSNRLRNNNLLYQSPSAVTRLKNSSLQSAVDCLRDVACTNHNYVLEDIYGHDAAPPEIVFRRSNSFMAKPYSNSDSSNKSRSSDSSQSTASSYLLNPYSTNSSSARSSSSCTKEIGSPLSSSKDQFKSFSSIVNSSMNALSAAPYRHKSASPAPSSSHYSSGGGRLVGNLDPVARSRVGSFKQDRSDSFRSSANCQAQNVHCSPDYSSPKPSPKSFSAKNSKFTTDKQIFDYPRVSARDRYVRHKHHSVSENPGDVKNEPAFLSRGGIRNFVLSKSASSKNLRNASLATESNARLPEREKWRNIQTNSGNFLDRFSESQRSSRSSLSAAGAPSIHGSASYSKGSSRVIARAVQLNTSDANTDNFKSAARRSVGPSLLSPSSSPRAPCRLDACSNGGSPVPWKTGSGVMEGHHSRGKPVKRNHSFCNDSAKTSRARLLPGHLPQHAAGSHLDIHQRLNGVDSFSPEISSYKQSGNSFSNIFDMSSNSSQIRAGPRTKSPPRTLQLNDNYYDDDRANAVSSYSHYAVPISLTRTPTFEGSCTINLQDSYPQISDPTSTLLSSPGSVTDSIKSQSSTLLSQMNMKSQSGTKVTPPNAGFDLEALLKIDDLRSWIQELETTRAKGYQTLYSDYDDSDWLEKIPEGDITQKGYEKKRTRLLQPYAQKDSGSAGSASGVGAQPAPLPRSRRGADSGGGGRPRRPQNRSVTSHEQRYLSEVRQEAVKEALAQYQSRPKNLPLPSKRASVTTARSPEHHHHDSDSEDSDDDSITAGGSLGSGHSSGPSATPDLPPPSRITAPHYSITPPNTNQQQHYSITPPNTNQQQQFSHRHNVPSSSSSADSARSNHLNNPVLLPPPTLHQQIFAAGGSSSSPPPPPSSGGGSGGHRSGGMPQQQHGFLHHGVSSIQQQPLPPVPPHSGGVAVVNGGDDDERRRREMTEVTDLMRNITTYCDPPDVTQSSQPQPQRLGVGASRDDRLAGHYARHPPPSHHTPMLDPENWRGTGRWKVSNKIQQLLNTLKRPKKRPLPEFYVDDEEDLEIAANPKDPNAPKPEGMVMTPAKGETLIIPAGLPRSVEAAVERYGGSSGFKASVATVLDSNNKLSTPLTYGKLLSRSQKMAYNLLSRLGGRGEGSVLPGDRVALIYPNCDPVSFMCALYACLQAGLVPVPIEVPISRRDAGSQQIGFLLGSCGVSVALTSEACFKGLPKNASGEVVGFKGWPKLNWFITDHLQKPPKEWQIPPKAPDDAPAYIEYSTDCDGSVKGVVVNRSALLNHCRSLTSACSYTEGEVAVCVLDFKRDVGLWHSMFCSVFNGMHVIFIPYSVMKVNPASWMHMITKFKASIAIVKSRDLHWGLLATKDHKDISLHSLRLLLVADGANPWSLSSCDQFLSVFQSKGLRPDAICPCAASPQALTVSVRRPGHGGSTAVGRGVLSMQGLSYGVVRVDQENSLTSLTLQDCGQVMPGAQMQVVRVEGPAYICRTDEVGEICVSGDGVGSEYWGLPGKTNHTFRVVPRQPPDDANVSVGQINQSPQPPPAETGGPYYVRTGLLGFLGPGGLVFVCGSRDGLMTVTGRKHNTDDIIATVLAVEPMKFIFRGRIAVFSQRVLRDERICIIAEQRPECSEEESFQWMSRVLQAVDSIHQVGIYCLALVPPNHLPKTPLGGIHLSETKKRFQEGCLHPANVLMCPHACVTNLPKPREVHHDVGPASVMVGNLVQGNRLAMAQGRDIGLMDDEDASRRHPQFIADILKWRASTTENHEILTLLNAKGQVAVSLTCSQLHKKAERVGVLLLEKGHINKGDHVALIYPPGVDLIAAFYGCLYVGAVPVTIRPPHPQNLQSTVNTVRTVVEVSKSVIILSTLSVIKLLKSKEEKFDSGKKWPGILDTDDLPKKRLPSTYRAPTPEMIAFLDFSVSTTGMLAGIKMSHASATALCLSMKVACELYPSRVVALCLDPYCGLGLALWVLSSVYSGHQSILIPPGEVEVNPALWLTAVSQYKVRDTFCSYGVMELCTKGLSSSITALKQRGINLACVRTCIVVAEERPRITLTNSFSKLFNGLGLSPRAVSTSFGCRVNVAVCLQGASSPDPSTVYVDLRSLRHDRVTLVERGAPHSLCLMESGKLLPGVKVVIANPETKGHCSDSHLGEIWVQSNHNSSGYFTVYGDDGSSNDHFNSQLVTGNTGEVYARTGCLGFLKRTESVQADGELHDAVFVVGSLDETVMQRGMRYHPIDIENTVLRCHKKISECAVFSWTNLMVVVVELDGQEYEALDLVPLITSSVVEEHQVIVGVIVVVDPGVVPINSRGEKQRMHLRDGFLADQLDPIYVAYNM